MHAATAVMEMILTIHVATVAFSLFTSRQTQDTDALRL